MVLPSQMCVIIEILFIRLCETWNEPFELCYVVVVGMIVNRGLVLLCTTVDFFAGVEIFHIIISCVFYAILLFQRLYYIVFTFLIKGTLNCYRGILNIRTFATFSEAWQTARIRRYATTPRNRLRLFSFAWKNIQ